MLSEQKVFDNMPLIFLLYDYHTIMSKQPSNNSLINNKAFHGNFLFQLQILRYFQHDSSYFVQRPNIRGRAAASQDYYQTCRLIITSSAIVKYQFEYLKIY